MRGGYKMKRIHKILAMVMSLLMVFGCSTMATYAAEVPEGNEVMEATVEPRSGVALSFSKDDWYPVANYNAGTFTAGETGTVRVAIDGVRHDGTKTETITLTINKGRTKVFSTTVNADGTIHTVQSNTQLKKGTNYKVVLSSSASQRMVVAGYVGIEN